MSSTHDPCTEKRRRTPLPKNPSAESRGCIIQNWRELKQG
uniref:Uncharacterized protein n=1 Tax=Cucumis melo TaxID=3656 RepID=A0A9I9EFI0_CUCME